MEPKEKAKIFVDKFYLHKPKWHTEIGDMFGIPDTLISYGLTKDYALIAVDEIIDALSFEKGIEREYWIEVKQEIEKL